MARRERSRRSLERRGPTREAYDRVLIVCEGEKTETNYLTALIARWQLSSANVQVRGDGGSAPISVVQYAIDLFEATPDYDRVYCVFDRDKHDSFDDAVARVREKTLVRREGKKKRGNARFEAIASIPCFEYWVFLHFKYSTAHRARFSDLEPHLRRIPELAEYDKAATNLLDLTIPRLCQALQNADRANKAAHDAGTDNPTTQMPVLIRYLRELAKKGY